MEREQLHRHLWELVEGRARCETLSVENLYPWLLTPF